MVKIKLCGLTRRCDIDWVNELLPDYVGFEIPDLFVYGYGLDARLIGRNLPDIRVM